MQDRFGPVQLRPEGTLTVKSGVRPPPARTLRRTVLFADLRGYTGFAERVAPAQLVPMLDEFFDVLAGVGISNGGTIYYMAGDGMMAGFGGPDPQRDGAREALAAGHEMLQRFRTVAARWRDAFSIDSGIGVGLHMGEVAIGLLGPPGHKSPTLVGDTVNVAARLCSRARAGEVLLSCTVAAALEIDRSERKLKVGPIPVLHLPQFALRGRAAPLDIWCVPATERAAL
jgi:class 3 adenylate cyclase